MVKEEAMQRPKTTPKAKNKTDAHSPCIAAQNNLKPPLNRTVRSCSVWTAEDVAHRFEDAAVTARRLPSANVQGYFNNWPTIVRSAWEVLAAEDRVICRFPPTPKDVEDMLEVMRWVQWLEVEQRHLVWMRANRYGWRDICARFGMGRTSAWQLWHKKQAKNSL